MVFSESIYQRKGQKKVGLGEDRQRDWSIVRDKWEDKKKNRRKSPSFMWFLDYQILFIDCLWFSPATHSPTTETQTQTHNLMVFSFSFASSQNVEDTFLIHT